MSDGSPVKMVKQGGGATRATVALVWADFCQHMTPPIVGYLNERLPIVGEQLWFEIIVLCLAGIGAGLVAPQHIVDSIQAAIIWFRYALKGIWNALVGQLPPQPPE